MINPKKEASVVSAIKLDLMFFSEVLNIENKRNKNRLNPKIPVVAPISRILESLPAPECPP